MALVDTVRNEVNKVITSLGDDMVLTAVTITGYNTTTHKNDITTVDHPAKGVFSQVTSNEVVEGLIGLTDMKCTFYADDFDIDETWLINGQNIITVQRVGFQNKLCVYIAYIRTTP